jgi:hypothetical protein
VPRAPNGVILVLTYTPRPRPSFLDGLKKLRTIGSEQRWQGKDGRIYTYDPSHGGELEVYNKRGHHIGVADARTGEIIKPAKRGRRIDV